MSWQADLRNIGNKLINLAATLKPSLDTHKESLEIQKAILAEEVKQTALLGDLKSQGIIQVELLTILTEGTVEEPAVDLGLSLGENEEQPEEDPHHPHHTKQGKR